MASVGLMDPDRIGGTRVRRFVWLFLSVFLVILGGYLITHGSGCGWVVGVFLVPFGMELYGAKARWRP